MHWCTTPDVATNCFTHDKLDELIKTQRLSHIVELVYNYYSLSINQLLSRLFHPYQICKLVTTQILVNYSLILIYHIQWG